MLDINNKLLLDHINTIVLNNEIPKITIPDTIGNILHVKDGIKLSYFCKKQENQSHKVIVTLFLNKYIKLLNEISNSNVFVIDLDNEGLFCYKYSQSNTNIFILFNNGVYYQVLSKLYFKDRFKIINNKVVINPIYTHTVVDNIVYKLSDINNTGEMCTKFYCYIQDSKPVDNEEPNDGIECLLCENTGTIDSPKFISKTNLIAENVKYGFKLSNNDNFKYYIPNIFFIDSKNNLIDELNTDIVITKDVKKNIALANFFIDKANNGDNYEKYIPYSLALLTRDELKTKLKKEKIKYKESETRSDLLAKFII